MYKTILSFGLAAFMLTTTSQAATADDNAAQELATATTHAQMADNAADTATALMHFHHVINCLVGPKSKQFDADVGNPCKGMGNGALNDVPQQSTQHAKLQHVLALLEQALHADSLHATQQYSTRISEALRGVDSPQ